MHKPIMLLLAFAAVTNACHAGTGDREQTYRCTAHPCANTPTGEDPAIVEVREGQKIEHDLRNDPDDARRWSSIILFSNSANKDNLTMPLVWSSKFIMRLDPKKGILHFSSPQSRQSFRISSEFSSQETSVCSKYQIRALDATPWYALITKTCPKQEYAPNRFYRGITYYLYDMKTATMRDIWDASRTFDTTSPFPAATPEIALKKTKDGYQFDWVGMTADDNPPTPYRIHRLYKRERGEDGQWNLLCYDTTRPRHPIRENGSCESGILERIEE